MTEPRKQVAFRGGHIAYHEMGKGEPLLMLHGSGPGVTAWLNFSGNLPVFAEHFRCIAPDLPGYGRSSSIDGDPFGGTIEAVVHLMDELGIERANFIGNSFGGLISARLAAAHPDRVRRLVTIGGVGVPIFNPFPYEGIQRLGDFVAEPSRERIMAWLRSMVFDQAMVTEELIELRMKTAGDPKALETNKKIYSKEGLAGIAAAMSGPDAVQNFAYLPKIEAPTLLAWGRDDRVTPLDGALVPLRLIPNAELHVFPKCGHWAMIEQKSAFEAVAKAFLTCE
jgi:pimeloyl-ACP methyl ester carboxylesterase